LGIGFLRLNLWCLLAASVLLGACEEPPKLQEVGFDSLPQWEQADLSSALEDFKASCKFIANSKWQEACTKAHEHSSQPEHFFESHFTPYRVRGDGLFTGYYQPVYEARKVAKPPFTTPIFEPPPTLVRLSPADFGRKGTPFYGEVKNKRLMPLSSRADINKNGINAPIIGWLKPAEAFFLAIQGSGILEFKDGTRVRARFAAKNGWKYQSIGKIYAKKYNLNSVTAQDLMTFIETNPKKGKKLMEQNPSYVFFTPEEVTKPLVGSLQVPLIPFRSMAVDLEQIPAYAPLWLVLKDTAQVGDARFPRLMLAHDSGGAIKGLVRGDIFNGSNFASASGLQNKGWYYLLLPNGYRD